MLLCTNDTSDTVITCFPQRWKQPKQDPLNMVERLLEDINTRTGSAVRSVFDLAMLVTGHCSGLFDRHCPNEQQYHLFEMFDMSIGQITDAEQQLFRRFLQIANSSGQGLDRSDETDFEGANHLADLRKETGAFEEVKDVRNELSIIAMILDSQALTVEEFFNAIQQEMRLEGGGKFPHAHLEEISWRYQDQKHLLTVHRNDITRMDTRARGIADNLKNLLELKQTHSNSFEARFAREQSIFNKNQVSFSCCNRRASAVLKLTCL